MAGYGRTNCRHAATWSRSIGALRIPYRIRGKLPQIPLKQRQQLPSASLGGGFVIDWEIGLHPAMSRTRKNLAPVPDPASVGACSSSAVISGG